MAKMSKHVKSTLCRGLRVLPVWFMALAFGNGAFAANLTWDSGNTNNGNLIDAANGTWNSDPANAAWNNGVGNVPWTDGNAAIFGGMDGAYNISVGSAISAAALTFNNGGY